MIPDAVLLVAAQGATTATTSEVEQRIAELESSTDYGTAAIAAIAATVSAVIALATSLLVERYKRHKAFETNAAEVRTLHQLEALIRDFTDADTFNVRRFRTLQKRVGGFDPGHLRRMLITVGAVRLWAANDFTNSPIRRGDELWTLDKTLLDEPRFQGNPRRLPEDPPRSKPRMPPKDEQQERQPPTDDTATGDVVPTPPGAAAADATRTGPVPAAPVGTEPEPAPSFEDHRAH